jgi:hypothetical protein
MRFTSLAELFVSEVADWHIFDANVRVGPSGVHGELALEAGALLAEMDRFRIEKALVSHWTAEEYDAHEGNRLLELLGQGERLVRAWAALPDQDSIGELAANRACAVRLHFGAQKHNFSPAVWCSGELYAYLQNYSVLTLVALEDIGWERLVEVLNNFPRLPILLLETSYRADRYLFPLLRRFPNIYFDTSTYVAHRQLESYVQRFGSERVVFGSRLPLYTPGAALAILASARIPDADRMNIAGKNLRRLLVGALS